MTITIKPKNKKELHRIKKILDAVEISFEESEDAYKEEFVKKILKSKQEIELLKEYKTALISEVVTGKVDVRDVILN